MTQYRKAEVGAGEYTVAPLYQAAGREPNPASRRPGESERSISVQCQRPREPPSTINLEAVKKQIDEMIKTTRRPVIGFQPGASTLPPGAFASLNLVPGSQRTGKEP